MYMYYNWLWLFLCINRHGGLSDPNTVQLARGVWLASIIIVLGWTTVLVSFCFRDDMKLILPYCGSLIYCTCTCGIECTVPMCSGVFSLFSSFFAWFYCVSLQVYKMFYVWWSCYYGESRHHYKYCEWYRKIKWFLIYCMHVLDFEKQTIMFNH